MGLKNGHIDTRLIHGGIDGDGVGEIFAVFDHADHE